jgi:protein TonB
MTGIATAGSESQSPAAPANGSNSGTDSNSNNKLEINQHVSQGLLIHKVTPEYPKAAKKKGIQGTVVLDAVIDKEGNMEDLHVVCGPPELTAAALKAVRQWKYRAYYLEGKAVEVETTININFQLQP